MISHKPHNCIQQDNMTKGNALAKTTAIIIRLMQGMASEASLELNDVYAHKNMRGQLCFEHALMLSCCYKGWDHAMY